MRKLQGQVGLLIVVVVGVLVALIMSVASGTLSDVSLSRQEKESGIAFHLAEQGVEEALNLIREQANLGGSGSYTGNLSFGNDFTGQYSIKQESGLNIYVDEGGVVEVKLAGYGSNSLTIEWVKRDKVDEDIACQGEGSGRAPAALEVIKYLQAGGTDRVYFNAAGCSLNNGFNQATQTTGEFKSKVTLTGMSQVSKLRLRPLYSGTTIGVVGVSLPSQVYLIQSKASGADVQKEIEVKRTTDQAGSVFDFALFSGGTIVK